MSQNPGQPKSAPPGGAPAQGNITLVIVALVMGFVAVVVTNIYVADTRAQVRAQTRTYYRLNKNIPSGQALNATKDLEPVQVPMGFEDAFPGAVEDTTQYHNEVLTRDVKQREVLRQDMFTSDGVNGKGQIPEGHAVKTIRVDRNNLSTAIQRNSLVDVYAVFKQEGSDAVMKVLNGVQVLRRGSDRIDVLLPKQVVEQVMHVEAYYGFQSKKGFELIGLPPTVDKTDWIGDGVNPAVLKLIRYAQK
jgi:hypothetical protein